MPASAWIASLPSTSASLPYWTAATRRRTPCPPTARTASRRPAVHQSRLGHHQQDSQAKHRQLTGSLIQGGRPAPLIGPSGTQHVGCTPADRAEAKLLPPEAGEGDWQLHPHGCV